MRAPPPFLAKVFFLAILAPGLNAWALCPATAQPAQACRNPGLETLLVKNKPGGTHDALIWRWTKGWATTFEDFGHPQTTAEYALCIYAGTSSALVSEIDIPPSSNWTSSNRSLKYRDKTAAADGAQKVILKIGAENKSSVSFEARGDGLPDLLDAGPLSTPVIVQLVNSETTTCIHGRYEVPWRNDGTRFFAHQ